MLPNYEEILRESLKDWFGKEDWVRINTSGNIAGPCGTMKKGKPTTRCLPRKKAQSLTKAERKATVAKKVRGSKKGKQFVKNTKKSEFKKKKQMKLIYSLLILLLTSCGVQWKYKTLNHTAQIDSIYRSPNIKIYTINSVSDL